MQSFCRCKLKEVRVEIDRVSSLHCSAADVYSYRAFSPSEPLNSLQFRRFCPGSAPDDAGALEHLQMYSSGALSSTAPLRSAPRATVVPHYPGHFRAKQRYASGSSS